MAKPPKLDEAKKRRVLRHVISGGSTERAARAVGCCRRTIERAAGRDELFGWRLRTARSTRDELRRRLREEDRLAAETLAFLSLGELIQELHAELSHAWAIAPRDCQNGCDISTTQDAA